MTRRVIFTIVSCNYIGFAATLMQSVRQHHPESDRFIILSDAMREFPDVDLAATLIGCDELNIALLDNMKLWYTVIEFNTAVKPFAFTHFLEDRGYDEALYIDPDIYLYRPLSEVTDALQDHSCVLTPHMMHPLQDGKDPSDHTIMKSGIYNLGFLALHNDPDARRLARWWSDRCYDSCRVDIPNHMFTDQRWMDLAPAFVDRPKILRHPGYNVAYWNLAHREVSTDGTHWFVDGLPLAFFHFSGIKPDDPKQFSKHQNRFTIDNLGPAAQLCGEYRENVLSNHWKKYSTTPYAFGVFADGRPIADAMRHWIARNVDSGVLDGKAPIEVDAAFFDGVDEQAAEQGATLTRFMYQFWLDRSDLRAAFDVFQPQGLASYFEWFTNGEASKQGVEARNVLAAKRLRGAADSPAAATTPSRRTPPWPSAACDVWTGPAHDVAQWLRQDVIASVRGEVLRVPRQAALVWESRLDLQQHFPCNDAPGIAAFNAWVLTSGFREGAVTADLMPPAYAERLTTLSSISAHYGDVPIVEGMIQTRGVEIARENLPSWQRFPVERTGRLAHGFWYAFMAPQAMGWPDEYVRSVRDWFMQRVDIECDGYRPTRALMALWELRSDIQSLFGLGDKRSLWLFLRWVAMNGLRELKLEIDDVDPELGRFLLSTSPRGLIINQITEMIHDASPELSAAFTLQTSEGRAALRTWADANLAGIVAGSPVERLLARAEGTAAPRADAEAPEFTTRVVLTGQWSTPSGRGEDVRGSADALLAVGFDDFLIVDTARAAVLRPDGSALPPGSRVHSQINVVHMNADTALADWMLLRRLHVSAERAIGFWAWELERLPSYWRHAYGFYDEIWSATRFADDAFRADDLRPVTLVPMVVRAPEVPTFLSRRDLGLGETETVFVFVFDFRSYASRKNPEAVVDAFLAAFPAGDEPVRLVMKTQGGQVLPEAWARLRERATDPRIEIRDLVMERQELLSLIKQADAFVSLHRSEGFGRGPAEAMLLGVPTIVTDYSGTCDFADKDCALPVDYRLVQLSPNEYPGVEGQRWADADVAHAATRMAWVHQQRDQVLGLGERARQRIIDKYSPSIVGQAMVRALKI